MPKPWSLGAQVRIIGELHGQQTVNVLHFATNEVESDVSPPSPLLLALVTAVGECIIEALLPAVTADWEYKYSDAKFMYNSGGSPIGTDPVVHTAPADSVGELGATSVSFASSLVNLRSGFGGRRGRGKIFLPPPGESNMTASDIDAGTMTLITAFLDCMAGKFLGASPSTVWRMGIYSRKQAAEVVGGGFDNAFFVASQLSPVQKAAVISSRKAGHGN